MKKIGHFIWQRKKISGFIIVLLVGVGIWFWQSTSSQTIETRYVLAAVEKSTFMTSVTGSGQIQGEAEIDVSPEASGKVFSVAVKNGQHVSEGDVLAVLDSTTAAKSVRDARLSLESANLSLQKLLASTDSLSLLQAQNALAQSERTLADLRAGPDDQEIQTAEAVVDQASRNLEQAERNLEEIQLTSVQDLLSASENGYDTVTEAFTKLSAIMDDLADFIGTESNGQEYIGYYEILSAPSYTDSLLDYYEAAKNSYDTAWVAYQNSDLDSETEIKVEVINLTLDACKDITNTLNEAQILLNKIQEEGYTDSAISDHIDSMIILIPADITVVNSYLTSLQTAADTIENTNLSVPNSVADAEDAVEEAQASLVTAQADLVDLQNGADANEITAAEEDLVEKKQQLADLEAGSDELDLAAQEIVVQKSQNALNDALEEYANYTVRAPISGTVANFLAYHGQSLSSGSSVATIVADQLTASISLNEVDVAKVKVGNKVSLTFDAIEDLTITGEVAEIDTIGTVSSGVVNYGVLITFDTQDSRVLSGMSVSATITTAVVQDAIVVSSSAVKSENDTSYVEVLDRVDSSNVSSQGVTSSTSPRQVVVEVGLSNDTQTQIVSGLSEGDLIVTKRITGSNTSGSTIKTSSSSTPSLLGGMGGGGPRD